MRCLLGLYFFSCLHNELKKTTCIMYILLSYPFMFHLLPSLVCITILLLINIPLLNKKRFLHLLYFVFQIHVSTFVCSVYCHMDSKYLHKFCTISCVACRLNQCCIHQIAFLTNNFGYCFRSPCQTYLFSSTMCIVYI